MIIINHDNNSKILNEIRNAKSIEKIHEIATKQGLRASHTFDMKWIALSESPTGEDIFIAREGDSILYKGKQYPVRNFVAESPEIGGEITYMIATESLSEALGDAKEEWDTEEHDIDCTIYFYVEDEVIGMDAKDICKNHLDVPMDLVEEV